MHPNQNHGPCTRCMSPLEEVDSYDIEAALRGEEVRIKRLQCPACIDELLGQLVDIMAAEDPQLREMFALLDQGVDPDDLPGYLKGEDERGLARLFGFLDAPPGEDR